MPGELDAAPDQATPNTERIQAGAVLSGRYLIEKELGRGGIGVVYLARDKELLMRPVVVKVLLEQSLQNEWVVQKFRQEMEALTRIEHPGIIGVLGAGETPEGRPYLVMQYVEGGNLRGAMRTEGMDLERSAHIMRQVGQALSAAHDEGVLHRDLKPENIMLRRASDGGEQVRLIDFGIAKIKDSVVAPSTVTAMTVGTIAYMAPEQLSAKPVSTASDIYALGVIAYEMVTGRRPFNPDSAFQLLEMQREGVRVRPQDLRPALPEAAQEVILKALSVDPRDRYQRAQDFGDGLARALTDEAGTLEAATLKYPEATKPYVPNQPPPAITTRPSPPPTDKGGEQTMQLAHVLFMDIVGYSKLPIDRQTQVLRQLQDIVRGTAEVTRAQASSQLISLPTGDGMALVFFSNLEAPVRCALEISKVLKNHREIELRMGIHSGPVNQMVDVNERANVAGAGINMAQRVMDCGDMGHILLSKRVADDLNQYSSWQPLLHDLGEAEVKHGVRMHIVNLYTDEVGNPELPEKFKKRKRRPGPVPVPAIAAAVLAVAVGGALVFWAPWSSRRSDESEKVTDTTTGPVSAGAPQRALSYWVEVQKYRDGKPDKDPFRLPGEMIFQAGDRVRFNFISPEAGQLYIVNEGPVETGGLPTFNMLFPTPTANNGSSALTANREVQVPGQGWFIIDDERGTEKLWLIWSARRVAQLETIAKAVVTTETKGVIGDPSQIKDVQEFLAGYSATQLEVVKDEETKQTHVRGKNEVLINLVKLEHY
jgi:serine/threonine protein kinase